jgi:hypothetical protein
MEFASNFVVEIFSEASDDYSARLAFNDKYYDVCNGDFIDKSSFRCNASSFMEVLNKSNEDLSQNCPDPTLLQELNETKSRVGIMVLGSILVVLAVAILLMLVKLNNI